METLNLTAGHLSPDAVWKAAEESTKNSSLAHEPQEGITTNADPPIEPASPSTIGGVTTQKPESSDASDGDTDLEESSSVSQREVISKLEEKIRVLESLLWDSNGDADLEGLSSVSQGEIISKLEDKIRVLEPHCGKAVTNLVLTTPYASLKRKVQEEQIKPVSRISLEICTSPPDVAGRYMSVVHNEVFRVAGRAGLINPADFDVGSDGVIGLSKHALKKVYSDDKS
ncbi:unnamed protein product [Fusarium fujikuroi]|uniref:Uncharacterized protein n=1 Tax=Fusarium fujikuroi TaxID=5127 RepID=A0A9Q9RIT6_FUSFU|nr:unnamed protein product [Fusarium fujikuroi]